MNDKSNNRVDCSPVSGAKESISSGVELDLVAELEMLAASETERFHELERQQVASVERMRECISRLGRAEPSRLLAGICQGVLREKAVLMDVDYLCQRSAEVLARESVLAPERPWHADFPLDRDWVVDRVAEALEDILLEDEEDYRDGLPVSEGSEFHHFCLVYFYGIDPARALDASVRFHRLCEETRCCFFALIVEQRSVERCIADGFGPHFRLKAHVQSALKALLFLEDLWSIDGNPVTDTQTEVGRG